MCFPPRLAWTPGAELNAAVPNRLNSGLGEWSTPLDIAQQAKHAACVKELKRAGGRFGVEL